MAYVPVPKDLTKVKSKFLFGLTKRQVFCFGIGAACGLPVFFLTKLGNKTVLILKSPKTITSTRKVFLPKTVAEMLVKWKADQDECKRAIGEEYQDYNLVIANASGTPVEAPKIEKAFSDLIKKNGLPPVVFHSLRHSSITYKLK